MKFPTTGLYAITQTNGKTSDTVVREALTALKAGVSILQYRDKNPKHATYLAKELLIICNLYKVPLIINDNVSLVSNIKAGGVHLGTSDTDILTARKLLGPDAIIGASCYDNINLALKAQENGADYVAFGRFFRSTYKPLTPQAHLQTLYQAKKQITIPIVAIGGILPSNGGQLLDAGANVLAVIGGIFDQNIQHSIQNYLNLFKSKT